MSAGQQAQQRTGGRCTQLAAAVVAADRESVGEYRGAVRGGEGGFQHQRLVHVAAADLELAHGPDREMPAGRVEEATDIDGPSKRGKQSQSTEPSRLTSAAERESESSAYSPIGRLFIAVPLVIGQILMPGTARGYPATAAGELQARRNSM